MQASIVIGFRNWGAERLRLCIDSVHDAFGSVEHEVLVSDYGSKDLDIAKKVCHLADAVHIPTTVDGPWSRSRALNIGFASASGEVYMCTDADMLFSPGSLELVYDVVKEHRNVSALIECLDLPGGWDDSYISELGFDWAEFERLGKYRGRWGMGGLIGVTRAVFENVGGLDERMHTYGAEDLDFGLRTQRAGNRILWIQDKRARMYHMWHESQNAASHTDPALKAVVDQNRDILYHDLSMIRNVTGSVAKRSNAAPLVSILITTQNRSNMLKDAIDSVLTQTVQDFEVVVVDDGSDLKDAEELVASYQDNRLIYHYQEKSGVAAAHNVGISLCSGRYVAILDDDDLMPPWRLETQLAVVGGGTLGAFGPFVNFDDITGNFDIFHSQNVGLETSFEKGGAPGHSTWLIEASVMKSVLYDTRLVAGSDNNLFLRLLNSGVKFAHCGYLSALRRRHAAQITSERLSVQKSVAQASRQMIRVNSTRTHRLAIEKDAKAQTWIKSAGQDSPESSIFPYLPDHLSGPRLIRISKLSSLAAVESLFGELSAESLLCVPEGSSGTHSAYVFNATWADLRTLRSSGLEFDVRSYSPGLVLGATSGGSVYPQAALDLFGQHLALISTESADGSWCVAVGWSEIEAPVPPGLDSNIASWVVGGAAGMFRVVLHLCDSVPAAFEWIDVLGVAGDELWSFDVVANDGWSHLTSLPDQG